MIYYKIVSKYYQKMYFNNIFLVVESTFSRLMSYNNLSDVFQQALFNRRIQLGRIFVLQKVQSAPLEHNGYSSMRKHIQKIYKHNTILICVSILSYGIKNGYQE